MQKINNNNMYKESTKNSKLNINTKEYDYNQPVNNKINVKDHIQQIQEYQKKYCENQNYKFNYDQNGNYLYTHYRGRVYASDGIIKKGTPPIEMSPEVEKSVAAYVADNGRALDIKIIN